MRFIDTNLLIRYFARNDEEKAKNVKSLLNKVENDEEKITTSLCVIFEIVYTLEKYYNTPRQKIKDALSFFLSLKGLRLSDRELYLEALELYSEKNISFSDAFNSVFCLKNGIKEIYSYDEDFDKIEGIKRIAV